MTPRLGFGNEGYQLSFQGKASVEAFPIVPSVGLVLVILIALSIALRKGNPSTKFP